MSDYESDSESSLPSSHSSEYQSSNPSEEWEKSVTKFISLRVTFHPKIDHTHFRSWVQTLGDGGVLAPEKGKRTEKLHYQSYIIGINKEEFDKLFKVYKQDNDWYEDSADGTRRKLLGGNKIQSVTNGKNISKLGPYCIKEGSFDTIIWGIPKYVIDDYKKLAYSKHDTQEIQEKMDRADNDYLCNRAADREYIEMYFDIWIEYKKNFNLKWLQSHYQMIKCKKDPLYKKKLFNSFFTLN